MIRHLEVMFLVSYYGLKVKHYVSTVELMNVNLTIIFLFETYVHCVKNPI